MKKLIVALLGLTFLVAACGPSSTPAVPEPTVEAPTSPISPIETPPEASAPAQPEAREAAVALLAGELGISSDEVTVLDVMPVDWPDTSLGCPQEGQMYAAVITPGYRFFLEAGGEEYEVHTDEMGTQAVRCDD